MWIKVNAENMSIGKNFLLYGMRVNALFAPIQKGGKRMVKRITYILALILSLFFPSTALSEMCELDTQKVAHTVISVVCIEGHKYIISIKGNDMEICPAFTNLVDHISAEKYECPEED